MGYRCLSSCLDYGVCLLDDKKTVVRGIMRATGDWVQVCSSQLYFLSRKRSKDRLVKRFGQRAYLDALRQDCLGLADDVVIEEDAHFMLSGGDSLQALCLYDEITVAMGTTPVGLVEVTLYGSFLDVLSQIKTETHINVNHHQRRE